MRILSLPMVVGVTLVVAGCAQTGRHAEPPVARCAPEEVIFQATGNEPPWLLDICVSGDLVLTTAYGEKTLRFRGSGVRTTAGEVIYLGHAGPHRIKAVIAQRPCCDSMSGAAFSHEVRVVVGDASYLGCGRRPTLAWCDPN